ncbi:MAG: hypothetical protein ACHQUC_05260 [Chlamydiales bacterium]
MKIFNCLSVVFIFICCVVISPAICDVPAYRLVDLGLQESDQSEAVAINDNGQVAGFYWMLGTKYFFIWDEKAGISLIDLPQSATIKALNNFGHIAGNYKDSTGNDCGFLWDNVYGFYDIGSLGGGFTQVYDMNDLGQIVGESECAKVSVVDGQKERHAFLWTWWNMVDLGTLPGDLGLPGDRSIATGINNRGQIIGAANFTIAHKAKLLRSEQRAVIWNDGNIEEFNESFDGNQELLSINDAGFVTSRINCPRSPYHPNFPSSGCCIIDTVSRCMWNISIGNDDFVQINNNGSVLSKQWLCFFQPTPYENHSNKCLGVDMREPIANLFIIKQTKPWRDFCRAYDMNNNNWIVGTADNIYGEIHAVLLVPIVKQ